MELETETNIYELLETETNRKLLIASFNLSLFNQLIQTAFLDTLL